MLLSPAEASRLVLENLRPFPSEDCPLSAAHGRMLRRELRADRAMPPFDRVTMDGFALRSATALAAAGNPLTLRVDGAPQAAGMIARALPSDPAACIEIMTGAVLPTGADCVVPYEDTTRDGATVTVSGEAAARLRSGSAVHRLGSDHAAGSLVVSAGTMITGREVAVAAACGHASVTVAASPRIAVVSTGDELVEIMSAVLPHQIRRSNDLALRASLTQAGFPNVECRHLRDVPTEIEAGLRQMLAEYDVVIVTGGVSKGRHDFIPSTLSALGVDKIFHGVAQRPGKPLWFGRSQRQIPVFALPGNPVSCFTCLHRYVLPALCHASGIPARPVEWVALAHVTPALPKFTSFVPVRIRSEKDGRHLAEADPFNTSGDFAGLIGTDGFVELPPQKEPFAEGQSAVFTRWT